MYDSKFVNTIISYQLTPGEQFHNCFYIYVPMCFLYCVCACVLSRVQLFATPWIVALSGSSVHGIFQARILKQVAISYSRGSS